MITDLPTALEIATGFSVVGLPEHVRLLPKRTLTLCQKNGLLPTYINQNEDKNLMIEYSTDDWYLAVVFWPDGEIDLFFKKGSELTRWGLTATSFMARLKSVLQDITSVS